MKSLVRWTTTLGLVGSTVLGSLLTSNLAAQALPENQIVQKLQSVPVFTVTDAQGAPLVASTPQPQTGGNANAQANQSVAGVFISRRDAQAFVDRLKTQNPQLGSTVQVVPVSLGEVYQLSIANQSRPNGLEFAYVPVQQQVQSAVTVLQQSGQQVQQFNGVPLFVARGGQDQGYLTVQQGTQQVIPFFFDREQLQTMVDRFKQQQPNLANTIKVQVVPLEGVLETLRTSNDQQLNNIVLVPSQESIEFLRNLPPASAGQGQRPATPPATTPQRPAPQRQ